MVRAANELGLKTRYFGGGMVGLQILSIKQQLGPQLNNILDYDWFLPTEKMLEFPGIKEFLKAYQAKAPAEGVDPLGWYLPPFAYAEMQVLQQAIEATKGLDQDKLADYIRSTAATGVWSPETASSSTIGTLKDANTAGDPRGHRRAS